MTKETLPIVILIATLVLLLVAFSVFLWEPIYELRSKIEYAESLEDSIGETKRYLVVLDNRLAILESVTDDFEARKDIVIELLDRME